MTKRYTEAMTIALTQEQKADLELKSLDEEVSIASIIRRAIRRELATKQHPQLTK